MSNFHLYHISFFDSLIHGLESNGVSLENLTNQSYISRFDIKNQNTYLPNEVGYEFFQKVMQSQQIDCISGDFYAGFEVSDLSEYGEYLSNCPDLYSILINAIKYDYLIQTHGKLELTTHGAISCFKMNHVDRLSSGRIISEKINLAMIFKAFQLVLGANWQPIELNISTDDSVWLQKLLPSTNFKINTKCDHIAIYFKTSDLAAKNKYYQENPELEHRDLTSMKGTADWVFQSMRGNYLPTVEEFAKYFGYSKRTALRKFASSGTSFKEIVEKHLYLKALDLLKIQSLSIEDVSQRLGYSHPSNFIRAFKRWTSTTPDKFRRQALKLS